MKMPRPSWNPPKPDDTTASGIHPATPIYKRHNPCAPTKITDAARLRELIEEYFDWCDANPIKTEKIVQKPRSEKGYIRVEMTKPRVHSIEAMGLHCGFSTSVWGNWKTSRPDLKPVIKWATATMYSRSLEGATAEVMNGSIVVRLLSLADKTEVKTTTVEPETVDYDFTKLDDDELSTLQKLLTKCVKDG